MHSNQWERRVQFIALSYNPLHSGPKYSNDSRLSAWNNLGWFVSSQEWEQKAVEAKERYTQKIREFEANGGDKNSKAPVGKKRKAVKKTVAKKKKADSDDDDDDDDVDSD